MTLDQNRPFFIVENSNLIMLILFRENPNYEYYCRIWHEVVQIVIWPKQMKGGMESRGENLKSSLIKSILDVTI